MLLDSVIFDSLNLQPELFVLFKTKLIPKTMVFFLNLLWFILMSDLLMLLLESIYFKVYPLHLVLGIYLLRVFNLLWLDLLCCWCQFRMLSRQMVFLWSVRNAHIILLYWYLLTVPLILMLIFIIIFILIHLLTLLILVLLIIFILLLNAL